jgi:hypothetical protein
MSRIDIKDAKGWVESTKFSVTSLDTDLLDQIETEVLGRIGSTYDTALWIDPTTTPRLVRTAIAKLYVVWLYRRTYAEDEGDSPYAEQLAANAELLVSGIIDGVIELPDANPQPDSAGQPSSYPNDLSSSMEPTWDDPSLGPAKFSMGKVF